MDHEHQRQYPPMSSSPSPTQEFATLLPTDDDSPMSWPLWKRIYTSFASFMAVFTLLYTTTTLSNAVPMLPQALNTTKHLAHLAFSIPFFGVTLAPIYTPHLSERFGRKPVYVVNFLLFGCVVLSGAYATTIRQVLAIRFLAGLVAGPNAVLIEGTFADIWSANRTVTYYVFIAISQYFGAAFGQVVGAYVLQSKGVRWLSFVALFFAALTFVMLVFMPETYPREILRRRLRKNPAGPPLEPALSGVTLGEMATHTLINPLIMAVSEPIVIMCALYLGFNFAVVFQWFISIPFVLSNVYGFSLTRVGLAFLSAIGGAVLAAMTSIVFDAIASSSGPRDAHGLSKIENRLFSAMWGSLLIISSLFWVGWTAGTTTYYVPIVGTGVFVWGNMSILISIISWIFDAYPPQGTLSALTTMACFRLICAGVVPIFILDMFANLTPPWALSTFGFIAVAMLPFPFILFFRGEKMRLGSRYSNMHDDSIRSGSDVMLRHHEHTAA